MEKFARFIKLIGEDKFKILQNKTVLIVGLGGVGGYALEGIVRSGIKNIKIVDYDKVEITNINRQIIALENNIGKNKVDVCKERALGINPNLNVGTICDKLISDNYQVILQNVDYVIDACDDINAKKLIITYCLKNKIKFISCMGTGNKFHPELLTITDLRKTTYDKLAKKLRNWAVKSKIKGKIMVVSSCEQCQKTDNIIGSTSYVPSVAGMLCASYVINDILKEK